MKTERVGFSQRPTEGYAVRIVYMCQTVQWQVYFLSKILHIHFIILQKKIKKNTINVF